MPAAASSLPPDPPATLRGALSAAGPRPGAALLTPGAALPLASMTAGTVLGVDRRRLQGRSVLLATSGQLPAALALIDLDGLAGRIVVCPPDLKGEHFASVIADAAVEVVVSDLDPAQFAGLSPVGFHPLQAAPIPLDSAEPDPLGTDWVLATSGTSGAPKLVSHTLAALTGAIKPVDPAKPLVWSTFYDIRRYGGLQIFLRSVLAGCTLVLSAPGEALPDHLRRLDAAGVTNLSGTPSHWRRVLMSAEAQLIAPAVVRLSGEIADQAVLDGLAETYPDASLGHAYASTEAGVCFEVGDGRDGFPAALLDAEEPCAMRVRDGSLLLRSARMATRYLGEGAAPLRDADGFFDSGDMVERRGDRLHFVGRRGGIINVGGLKVHPEEIEAVINRHPAVRMSLVKSRRSPIMGAVVVAEIVLEPGSDAAATPGAVMAACRAALPVHKVPATVRVVPALDVTAAGKLSRSAA